jgi:hypothetical protein
LKHWMMEHSWYMQLLMAIWWNGALDIQLEIA